MDLIRNAVRRGLAAVAFAMALLAAAGMTAIVVIIVTSVTLRKLAQPLYFTEEVVGLLLSVSLFLALPMVTLKAGHVRVSIVESAIKGWGRSALAVLAACVGIGFCAWVTYEAMDWLAFALRLNLKTETSRILLFPWMALMPLSLGLTGVMFLARLFGLYDETAGDDASTADG